MYNVNYQDIETPVDLKFLSEATKSRAIEELSWTSQLNSAMFKAHDET